MLFKTSNVDQVCLFLLVAFAEIFVFLPPSPEHCVLFCASQGEREGGNRCWASSHSSLPRSTERKFFSLSFTPFSFLGSFAGPQGMEDPKIALGEVEFTPHFSLFLFNQTFVGILV